MVLSGLAPPYLPPEGSRCVPRNPPSSRRETMVESEAIEYGPLTGLIGTWEGNKGLDVAPEPGGSEESPYLETIVFDGAGIVENAESQRLAAVRYHQVVRRQSDGEVFHDQVGYWMWDPRTGVVMQSVSIPRGVCVLAGGVALVEPEKVVLAVKARHGDETWGVVQSPFMLEKARTVAFEHELTLVAGVLSYRETTSLEIYGRAFEHTDRSELSRQ